MITEGLENDLLGGEGRGYSLKAGMESDEDEGAAWCDLLSLYMSSSHTKICSFTSFDASIGRLIYDGLGSPCVICIV